MKQNKYNIVYVNNTIKNVYAFSKKEAKKIADKMLKDSNILDTFVKVDKQHEFEGFFYSNR